MLVAAPGPSLLALARNTNSTITQMGYIFTARSFGYLVGSAGGPLFDRLDGNKLICAAFIATATSSILIPYMRKLWLLASLVSVGGFAMGFGDTGGNVGMIRLHKENVGPYLQSLHFSFGVGAFISPAIFGRVIQDFNGDPKWGFVVIGILTLPLAFLVLAFKSPDRQGEESVVKIGKPEKIVAILTGVFLGVYVGAEVSGGGWFSTYSVLKKMEDETGGAYLESVYWGTFTFGRLLAIPGSLYLKAWKILIVNLSGCALSTILMLMFLDSRTVLWLGAALYGLFMSSTFPCAIHLAEDYMSLTGTIASVLVIGASVGEMLVPLLIAHLITRVGTESLIVVLFACSLIGAFILFIVTFVGRFTKKKKSEVEVVESPKEIRSSDDIPTVPLE